MVMDAYDTSRSDAIERGTLIDVTAAAELVGVHYPVALSRAAWTVVGEKLDDVVQELARKLRATTSAFVVLDVDGVRLLASFEAGDDREPVVTIKTGGER